MSVFKIIFLVTVKVVVWMLAIFGAFMVILITKEAWPRIVGTGVRMTW